MGKYDRLQGFLRQQTLGEIPMRFSEVEEILGGPLPDSARKHRPWWGNEPVGHVHAQSWINAGFRTERVDMSGERVVFVRRVTLEAPASRHPLLGSLKGLLRPADGVDPTEPADPDWAQLIDDESR